MDPTKITFPGHNGQMLAARYDAPRGRLKATAVFAHCFTCSKDIPAARRISQRLAALGIGVLRFDFTGLGHSEGEFANTGFTSNVADIVAAADHLRETVTAPTLLVGHSLGGAAVLKAATEIPGIKAVATLGAPADPAHVLHNFHGDLAEIESEGAADVTLAGRKFRISRAFLRDVEGTSLLKGLRHLKASVLVMHAPQDKTVGIDNASEIFRAARHPKSFVTLDDSDHLISDADTADYAAGVIAAWARRYLGLPADPAPKDAPEGVTRISEADPKGFLQDIAVGADFHLLADEPLDYGGSNLGPSPYQLVAAGLGACTTMTLRLYARRKKLALTHVEVDVTHDKIHAKDSENSPEKSRKVDLFRRIVRLEGDLTEAERKRLVEIADRCPVHQTLSHGSVVETVLEPS